MTYRLSKHIKVVAIDSANEHVPEKYKKEHFILNDESRHSEYLVNSTIKYYLDKFSTSKTEEEVLKEVENDVQSTTAEVREVCSSFFQFLCEEKILVQSDFIETEIATEPLYKEGDMVDEYRIQSVLSSRRYTDVYAAMNNDGERVVIKIINSKKTVTEKRFARELADLQKEYDMLQKASHLSVVNQALGFKITPGESAYLALEFIEGKSVGRFLKETPSLTSNDCLQMMEDILKAFATLHNSRLIHGDIHSSNVLVTSDKKIRIIDLGFTQSADADKNEIVSWGGVYFYMPPERINTTSIRKYPKEADLFSDVYQIGVLLYLILYNKLPYDGFTWEELSQNIKDGNAEFQAISFLNEPVSQSLIDVVKKCLDPESANRYKSATEIEQDLEPRLKGLFVDYEEINEAVI